MSKPDTPKFVTALFSFKGKNNDELCFKKGDVITITQIDEGGWWEGTLHDKTGWFPSNYVKECRVPENSASPMKATEKVPQESPVHQKLNRDIVLKDLVDSERVNVAELQGLINSFLHPLESANILNKEEYKQLLGNVHEVLEVHQRLLSNLEAAMTQDSRVGNLFLTLAPKLKSIHTMYCRNHPKAVCILDRYRDELNDFMERSGAISPGILVLTTGLSKPFRRLDKYSAMLQELERYTERNHPDRGDTQRSIAVYREIADRCASIRKQRELALQVLTSGIKGWEGEELSSLGEILYVGSVTLASGTTGLDRRDRYFVLFSTTLLVLSASPRMSSFVYEGKLPLTGITITQVEDTDEIRNAFEITGPMIESILVLCGTKEDQQRWIELLIQEQTTNNSLVKSSTTSRVSYSLPPYARLSRYFAKLVRQKIIRPELLKKLLYLQYVLRPDMSNVKMRRTNITTYVLHPMQTNSQDSCSHNYSASFESNKIATRQSFVGTTMLRKSTLTLNVKYALADIDLSTVGITKGSSLTELISAENDTRGEISKSLPLVSVGSSITAGFSNNNNNLNTVSVVDEQLACRSRFTNLARSFPIGCNFHQDTLGETKKHIDVAAAIKCWKSKEFTEEPPITINSVHRPSVPVCNSNIIENCCQANVISVGSSDSGMAESYRLNSSEINSSCKSCTCVENKYSIEHPIRIYSDESENDENNFEYQCVCTSPFGSTPRDSAHLSDSSKHNDNTLDSPTCETASTIVYNSDHAFATNKIQTKENVLSNKYEHTMQRRFTQPIPYTHQSIVRKVGRKAIQPTQPVENDYNGTHQIYTSGLYAHWWLKKSIPFSGCSDQGKLPWHGCLFLPTCLISVFACVTTNCIFLHTRAHGTRTHARTHIQREMNRVHEHISVCFHFTAMLCEICSQQSGKQQQQQTQQQQRQSQQHRSITEHCVSLGIRTPWSIASLRPAPPFYSFKVFDERQFEEDAIILKVIEAYCLSVNARFTVHSGESTSMLEYDSHKMRDRTSLMHNRGNWDFCSNRTLSETVRTLKNQMTDLQSQMSLLTKQLDEERRSRLSLAATVKRSIGVVDGSVP